MPVGEHGEKLASVQDGDDGEHWEKHRGGLLCYYHYSDSKVALQEVPGVESLQPSCLREMAWQLYC